MRQSSHSLLNPITASLHDLVQGGNGIFLLVGVVLLLVLFLLPGQRPTRLAQAKWAGHRERRAAARTARQQMRTPKKNRVSLYIGHPRFTHGKTIFLPDAQRGTVVSGSPGSGKTYSAIDPLIRSAIEQALTIFLFDVKGEQMKRHVAYAVSQGYQIYVFAPGFPYSDCVNLLDFLRDEADATMARQIATIINRNSKPAGSKPDDFFAPAGDQLLETVLLMAKATCYDDLLTAWKLLSLPGLALRLREASHQYALDLWAEVSATQLMSVADAERTVSGIVGTAVNTFSQFIKRDFLPSIVGQTSIPLLLDGKQMVVFQIDEQRETVTAPLVASVLTMLIKRNMNNTTPRTRGLALFLDEFPSLYLPDLEAWVNRFREYGLCTVLGYQNQPQLRRRYGEHDADSTISGCATKLIFNPGHEATAASWSKYLGEQEVVIKPRSRTHGKSYSHGYNEQYHRIPLMAPEALNMMGEGECIVLNPGYRAPGKHAKTSVPWHLPRIFIPPEERQLQETCVALWHRRIEARLIQRAERSCRSLSDDQLREELLQRGGIADWVLPDPAEPKAADENAQQTVLPR